MKIGGKDFIIDAFHTYIMGILNVTPDSFSDGGRFNDPEAALRHALSLIEEGADIIDIGAESTRPGHRHLTEEEELDRLLPALRLIKRETDIPVSIDSRNPVVMDAALSEGGDLANDILGFRGNELYPGGGGLSMAEVVAKHGKPAVIMHNDLLGREEDKRTAEAYAGSSVSEAAAGNVLIRVREGLDRSLKLALDAGIDPDKLILDPGIGFAKSTRESLQLLKGLREIKREGEAWLLAASRKSVIGDVLELPTDQREEGTMVTTMLAVEAGYSFVRVHDVEKNRRVIAFLQDIRAN